MKNWCLQLMGLIKVTLPHFPGNLTALSPKKFCLSFVIFDILFHVAATIKNFFFVKNGVKLVPLTVAQTFYNNLIPLNEVWPRLRSKYFGKLFDIYQLNVVKLHLWKLGVCTSWGKLKSHYPVFLGGLPALSPKKILVSFIFFWLTLLSASWVGNMKHVTDGLKYTLKWALFAWPQGPIQQI